MRRAHVPPGRVVVFRPKGMALEPPSPEPAGKPGEFVEMINALAELWASGHFDSWEEQEAPPNSPQRADLRIVGGTDYEAQTAEVLRFPAKRRRRRVSADSSAAPG